MIVPLPGVGDAVVPGDAPVAGGVVVAPGFVPGAHGGCRLAAAPGVEVAPGPVPGVRGEPGLVVEFGVDTVCPGVRVDGGLCVLLVGGTPSVFGRVPGVLGVAVPVPTPAGTHGIDVGDVGAGCTEPGTVVGVCGVGLSVPCGVGAMVPEGVGVTVPVGVGGCAGVGAVDGGLGGGFCAATAITETANARANALEIVVMLRVIDRLLWEIDIASVNAVPMPVVTGTCLALF